MTIESMTLELSTQPSMTIWYMSHPYYNPMYAQGGSRGIYWQVDYGYFSVVLHGQTAMLFMERYRFQYKPHKNLIMGAYTESDSAEDSAL